MTYHFVYYFTPGMGHIPEKDRIEIAKCKAIEDLAKELMKNAHFELDEVGNVKGTLEMPPYNGGHYVL